MVPTNCIQNFLRYNDSELRFIVAHFCKIFHYPEPIDDIIQDLYHKFLVTNILQRYNRYFSRGTGSSSLMVTYLYPIVRNYIFSRFKSQDYRYMSSKWVSPTPKPFDDVYDELEMIDKAIQYSHIGEEFKETLQYNGDSDQIDGLRFEIEDFENFLMHSVDNKKFNFRKGKKKISKCTLLEIFRYIYKGWSNKEIADLYGVSNMTITHMKHKLAGVMSKYGFCGGIENNNKTKRGVPNV